MHDLACQRVVTDVRLLGHDRSKILDSTVSGTHHGHIQARHRVWIA